MCYEIGPCDIVILCAGREGFAALAPNVHEMRQSPARKAACESLCKLTVEGDDARE